MNTVAGFLLQRRPHKSMHITTNYYYLKPKQDRMLVTHDNPLYPIGMSGTNPEVYTSFLNQVTRSAMNTNIPTSSKFSPGHPKI
jgi:hypothetical protein